MPGFVKIAYYFSDFGLSNRLLVSAENLIIASLLTGQLLMSESSPAQSAPRERISIDDDWRFTKGDPPDSTVSLLYDMRPSSGRRGQAADANASAVSNSQAAAPAVIKQWILPSGNDFISDPARRFVRPEGNLGDGIAYVQPGFDDSSWRQINLPHDWAIDGPFTSAGGGGMGRLASSGIGWYRKKLAIPAGDAGKEIFLDVDGAMSYSTVWLNGQLAGGWPYGYASWRLI